ncbi:hypothetical protein QBC46DRAFT_273237, partial [Diplogelasinospora grovesii]
FKPLSNPRSFFDSSIKHSANVIMPENYTRKYCFLGCEQIEFHRKNGGTIWTTTGEGEIELPAQVGAFIRNGKMRQVSLENR